jgi:hypothetical protein
MIFKSLLVAYVNYTSPNYIDFEERQTSIPLDYPEVESLTSFPPTTLMLNYLEENWPTIDGL